MLHVLYVEDDPASRNILQMIQRMNPDMMTLNLWSDSNQFEEKLCGLEPSPKLILLDIHVKPYSGFEMLKLIRKHREYDTVPVVALTASVMNEEVELLREAGFQGALSKPLNMDEFPNMIQRITRGESVWHVW